MTSVSSLETNLSVSKDESLIEEPPGKKRKICVDEKLISSSPTLTQVEIPISVSDTCSTDLHLKNGNASSTNKESLHEEPSPIVSIDFDTIMQAEGNEISNPPLGSVPLNPNLATDELIQTSEEDEDDEEDDDDESTESSSNEISPSTLEKNSSKKCQKVGKRERKRRGGNRRRNIKEVIGTDKLDEKTVAAQKEEWARRERIAAKQRALYKNSTSTPALPLSMEEIIERFSETFEQEAETKEAQNKQNEVKGVSEGEIHSALGTKKEVEVLTLSSDSEEEESSKIKGSERFQGPSNSYNPYFGGDFYPVGSSRNRESGGMMFVNMGGSSVKIDSSEVETVVVEEDDDCVVCSPTPLSEMEDEEKDEDEVNVPDEQGRILVNVGHPEDEPDIFLPPQIARAIKPHQIGGVRFLYDNVVESIERYKNSAGLGCILAHSMGLGKTIQAVSFCDIFLNHTGANSVLVIVPINTIQNWLNEFNHWTPPSLLSPPPSTPPQPLTRKRGRKKRVDESQEQFNELMTTVLHNDDGSEDKKEDISSSSKSNGEKREESEMTKSNGDNLVKFGEELESDGSEESSKLDYVPRTYDIFLLNETVKTLSGREKIISEWKAKRGVLLIGYEMYRMLAQRKLRKSRKKKFQFGGKSLDDVESLNKIYEHLVNPGPDLVICDEGHRIKNSGAGISQALKEIKTRRRVVLTGYPLQNNLMEYHCMVDFVAPNYLGTKNEFSNMFERPITNGQCIDSTLSDKRLMQFRSHVLHSLLEGFVQRRSHMVLQRALPPKEEWVFFIKMTPIQVKLYQEFINFIRRSADEGHGSPNPIKAFAICCKIWNHPDVLYNLVIARKEQVVLDDLEDLAEAVEKFSKTPDGRGKKLDGSHSSTLDLNSESAGDGVNFEKLGENERNGSVSYPVEDEDSLPVFSNWSEFGGQGSNSTGSTFIRNGGENSMTLEWSREAFSGYVPNVLENGTKFELLLMIVKETVAVGDKMLVFSQSLLTLNLMELFFGTELGWIKGREYFRLDGSTTGLERERLIGVFNKSPRVHLFLVSTRAGSLGINLVGANRVIVFDASWNPCHDCQAVCRIYRYGQKKRCRIYRFVADCTLEKTIYDRQISKRGMANRVVDEMNPELHFSAKDISGSLVLELNELLNIQSKVFEHEPEKFEDPVIQKLLREYGHKITKTPFEHESLLIDRKEKKLSKSERRLAVRNYEQEKQAIINGLPIRSGNSSTFSRGLDPQQPFTSNKEWTPIPILPYSGHSSQKNPMDSMRYGNEMYRDPTSYNSSHFQSYGQQRPRDVEQIIPFDELRKKGIHAQGIILKKDSFLQDPDGGPDIFLMAGQKVYLFRSKKGAYLRLSNGRFIAIRNIGRSFFDSIPPNQDLTKEQVYSIINSILRPKISSTILQSSGSGYSRTNKNYFHPPSVETASSRLLAQSRTNYPPPPMSVPLPPNFPYSGNNVGLHRTSSGNDMTIFKKNIREGESGSGKSSRDIVPEIEVLKINPQGDSLRIKPNELNLELERSSNMNLNSDTALENFQQQKDSTIYSKSTGSNPLLELKKLAPPSFKLSDDVVIDFVGTSTSSSSSKSNSRPYSASNSFSSSPYHHPSLQYQKSNKPLVGVGANSFSRQNKSQLLESSMPKLWPTSGNKFLESRKFDRSKNVEGATHNSQYNKVNGGYSNGELGTIGSRSTSLQYYNGNKVAEIPLFTPEEQEILDRHVREQI